MSNLFYWAKKELSQDAVLATLLDDKIIGPNLVRTMLSLDCDGNTINSNAKSKSNTSSSNINIQRIVCQGHDINGNKCNDVPSKIDIFVEFIKNGVTHYLIIEDKTSTDLHDNQVKKYIDKLISLKKDITINSNPIHFVLFKTGPYYFWQRDNYLNQQKNFNDITFHCMLLPKFKNFLNKYKNNNGFGWFDDYHKYIINLSQSLNKTWMEDLNITKTVFYNKTIPNGININRCNISLPVVSNGKRPYEYKIYGFCGHKANRNNFKTATKDSDVYFLLPIVTFHYDNTYTISLNLHKYVTDKNEEGYKPKKSTIDPTLREKAIKALQDNGFTPNSSTRATLNIYKSKPKSINNNTGAICYKQIKNELTKLIDVVEKIQKII